MTDWHTAVEPLIHLKRTGSLPDEIEAPCSKSPTRQSRYGEGALRGMRLQANSGRRYTAGGIEPGLKRCFAAPGPDLPK